MDLTVLFNGSLSTHFRVETTLIILLTLTSCYKSDRGISNLSLEPTVKRPIMVLDTTTFNSHSSDGWRESFDSGNFSIIRRYHNSTIKYIESHENKLTKLCNWKEWYKNGIIKEEGIMTSSSHQYIGIWKYYSPSGRLDSIVDHDAKYPIPYFKALKIAKKYGFNMPDMEVTLIWEKDNIYYEVARWRENQNHMGQTADFIYIDTKTGVVMKPDKQLIRIY